MTTNLKEKIMNSRDRVLTAINHKTPDRVPITFDAEKEVIEGLMNHFNVSTKDEVWDALNVDTRLIGVDHNDSRIREENGLSYDFWGIGSVEQTYSGGSYMEYAEHPLADMETIEEIENYNWPDPAEISFDALRENKERNPDKATIAHITHGGYFKATHLRGMENFMLDLGMNQEIAEKIIEKVTDYIFGGLERLCKEAGDTFDIFYIADDFCTANGPMFSPDTFCKIVKPYLTRIADIVHSYDKKFLIHVCGSVRTYMPHLIEAGVDLLEPIQTSAVGMEVEGLKSDFGKDLSFYGSIDLIKVLSVGTPEEVRQEVQKNFKILGKQGGFIVGPGHTYIQPDVPIENILSMYKTAYEECIY